MNKRGMGRRIRYAAITAIVCIIFIATSLAWVGQKSAQSEVCREGAPRPLFIKERILVCASVADTVQSRAQGLSGRAGLAEGEGMLFVFPQDGKYGFWMKDMRFSIDILWLAADGKIVYIAENVSPDSFPQSFESDVPARYVLELPAGYTALHSIAVGDGVRL